MAEAAAAMRWAHRFRALLMWLAVGGSLAAAWSWWHHRATHVVSNDARVAAEMIVVASRAPGWLVARPVSEGGLVRRGQPLAQIYSEDARLASAALAEQLRGGLVEVKRIQARLAEERAASHAAVREAQAERTATERAVAAAELSFVTAGDDFARERSLAERGMVSRQRVQHSETAYETARQSRARLDASAQAAAARVARAVAGAQLQSLETELELARVKVDELRARLLETELALADRSILAPLDGVIDRTFANAGDYLAAGQRILMMHDPQAVWVEVNVKETDVGSVRPGQPVALSVDAYPDRSFTGRVLLVGNSATSTFALLPNPNPSGTFTKVTQRIPVRVAVRQLEGLLKPGMMVEASIDVRER